MFWNFLQLPRHIVLDPINFICHFSFGTPTSGLLSAEWKKFYWSQIKRYENRWKKAFETCFFAKNCVMISVVYLRRDKKVDREKAVAIKWKMSMIELREKSIDFHLLYCAYHGKPERPRERVSRRKSTKQNMIYCILKKI